ncbi:hypothetical protein BDB00DRAFT_931643 [Zychaea mexicana]|uniref:uncharacterized protein n=1 Tax=Zychaea mexicana TaxID=64656 RepID=UPI0022FE060B|nr:uncharacterized protein BDB00DRAFT_931643 [Zychaea mexicana]KAI9489924.1 hypothetical protein BDB00DRAFT_931643 [Zychaea mexicana]
MFADFYDVVPVALTDEDGSEVDLILSPSHIEQLQTMLARPQQITLTRPTQELSPVNMFPTRDTVHSLGEKGAISNYLSKRHYIELNKEITETLNQDWEIKPNQCYMVARALSRSVMLDSENHRGLLILSLEVYGRDPEIESHAEQRSTVDSTHLSTLVPSIDCNDFAIGTLHQTEGKNVSVKLILGAYQGPAMVMMILMQSSSPSWLIS